MDKTVHQSISLEKFPPISTQVPNEKKNEANLFRKQQHKPTHCKFYRQKPPDEDRMEKNVFSLSISTHGVVGIKGDNMCEHIYP